MRSRTVQPLKNSGQGSVARQPGAQRMQRVSASDRRMGNGQRKPGSSQNRNIRQQPRSRQSRNTGSQYAQSRQSMDGRQRYAQSGGTRNARTERRRLSFKNLFVTDAQYFDYDLLLVIIFLMCFGLVMLYSASAYNAQVDFGNDMQYFVKQGIIAIGGFGIMWFVSKFDYHVYGAFSFEIYLIAMFLMALVQTPLGVTINGARRWIGVSESLTIQPAEITKIAVILFISYELCRLGAKAYTKDGAIRIFAFGILAAGGVMFLTDNLSTAIIVMAITCILYFVVHPNWDIFIKLAAAGSALIVAFVTFIALTMTESDNFRLRRIITWLDPENHGEDGGFQVMQGLYAIGSGGFFGKGLGNSTQKLGIIPEVQNDMILTIICEELGVFGAIVILILFGVMLYRLMFIAKNAPDMYGALLATGIFAHIALQVCLNIAVVTNCIPNTGVTLPFISYGGTSIVFLMVEMGIALGISRKVKIKEKQT